MKKLADKIVIYGAGVIGSIYATKMSEYGVDVTILKIGKRLQELRKNGLTYKNNGIKRARVKVVPEVSKEKI